jgi:hypothetical protein
VELVQHSHERAVQQPDGFQPGSDQQHWRWRRHGSFARGIAVGVALNRLIFCSDQEGRAARPALFDSTEKTTEGGKHGHLDQEKGPDAG